MLIELIVKCWKKSTCLDTDGAGSSAHVPETNNYLKSDDSRFIGESELLYENLTSEL